MKSIWMTWLGAAVAVVTAGCGSDVASFPSGSTSGTGSTSSTTGAGGSGQGGSGQGGAGQGGAGQGGAGQGGTGQGGSAACIGCSDILQGGDPNDACTMNGPPSSSDIWSDFNQCVCVANCPTECATACQGQGADQACQQCVGMSCQAEAQACIGDGGSTMCSTCSQVLQGSGDPANLCTQSQQILADLFQCVCQVSCTAECGDNVCMGGQPSQACQTCIGGSCGNEIQACLAD